MQKTEEIVGLSLKAVFATMIGILLFGIYLGILIFGENSLMVLDHLREKKTGLIREEHSLRIQNQKLQKEYFELKQLEPDETLQEE